MALYAPDSWVLLGETALVHNITSNLIGAVIELL